MPFQRGFTLLELMVVVAITGIMAGLSASALEPMVRRIRVSGAADVVADGVAFARLEAKGANRCARVEILNWQSGSAAAVPPQPLSEPGNAIRVLRWNDADCEPSSAATYAGVTYVETFFLPHGSVVGFVVGFKDPGGNPLVWRSTGRLLGQAEVQLSVVSDADPGVRSTVAVEPNGPICTTLGSGGEACP